MRRWIDGLVFHRNGIPSVDLGSLDGLERMGWFRGAQQGMDGKRSVCWGPREAVRGTRRRAAG